MSRRGERDFEFEHAMQLRRRINEIDKRRAERGEVARVAALGAKGKTWVEQLAFLAAEAALWIAIVLIGSLMLRIVGTIVIRGARGML
jgi:hypothetical protein